MTTPGFSNMYSQNAGMTPSVPFSEHFDVRSPTSTDVNYQVGTFWLWPNNEVWVLSGFSTAGGTLTANWVRLSDSDGPVESIIGTAPIAASTSGGVATISMTGPANVTTLTAHGVLIGEGASSMVATAVGANGQVLLGSTGLDPAFGTLTTSTGIAYTTGAAALAVDVKTGGYAVVDQTSGSANLAVQTMYVTDNGASLVTYTLPATAPQGSVIKVVGSSVGGWKIAQNASQKIVMGASTTTAGTSGSLSSTNKNDCVELIASVGGASTVWTVASFSGTLTFV